MNNTNLPAKRAEFVNPVALEQINQVAQTYIKSNALPPSIENGAQLQMVLMAGYEAGMNVIESINSYYIVNGRVTIYGAAVLGQLRKAGYSLKWITSDDTIAKVEIETPNGVKHTEVYTIEEAQNSGLLTPSRSGRKTPWQKYPKEMLRHKAIGRAVRFFCPEVLNGFYLKEELEGTEPFKDKKVYEAKATPAKSIPDLTPGKIKTCRLLWSELMTVGNIDKDVDKLLSSTLIKKYAKHSLEQLTEAQADDFIKSAQEKIAEKKAENAPVSDDNTPDEEVPENEEKTSEEPKTEATQENTTTLKPGYMSQSEVIDTTDVTDEEIEAVDQDREVTVEEILESMPQDMGGERLTPREQMEIGLKNTLAKSGQKGHNEDRKT